MLAARFVIFPHLLVSDNSGCHSIATFYYLLFAMHFSTSFDQCRSLLLLFVCIFEALLFLTFQTSEAVSFEKLSFVRPLRLFEFHRLSLSPLEVKISSEKNEFSEDSFKFHTRVESFYVVDENRTGNNCQLESTEMFLFFF